jgi:very-short-patch-repair endonuclease
MSQKDSDPFHTAPELWRKLKPLARQMRHEPTFAEDRLWQQLRNRRLGGAKFRRQYTIDRFIVDFYCPEARLVVEVDGAIHEYTQEEDAIRQAFIESLGMRVLRFTNAEVIQSIAGVLERIGEALEVPYPPHAPHP